MVKALSKPEKISEINQIPLILTYKNVKNINIRFKDDAVYISAPPHLSVPEILKHINPERIKQKLETLNKSKSKQEPHTSSDFIPHHLRFFGRTYQIEYSDKASDIRLHKKSVLVPKSLEGSPLLVEALDEFIKKELTKFIDRRLAHWEKITGLTPNGYQIRKMKTRWGSCTHSSGQIRFNFYLSVLPRECIDTVILHELTHLKITNHQDEFYDFIYKYLPSYQRIHSKIKSFESPEVYLLGKDKEL